MRELSSNLWERRHLGRRILQVPQSSNAAQDGGAPRLNKRPRGCPRGPGLNIADLFCRYGLTTRKYWAPGPIVTLVGLLGPKVCQFTFGPATAGLCSRCPPAGDQEILKVVPTRVTVIC